MKVKMMFDRTEYNRKYYELNRERLIKQQIEYNKANPEIYKANNHNHYINHKIEYCERAEKSRLKAKKERHKQYIVKKDHNEKLSNIFKDMEHVKYLFDTERALDIADVLELTGWDLKYVTKICTKMNIKNSQWYYQRIRKGA